MSRTLVVSVLLLAACDLLDKGDDAQGVQSRLDALAERVAADDKKIEALEKALEDAKSAPDPHAADVEAFRAELSGLEARVHALETTPDPAPIPPSPGRPDPAERYKVDISGAQSKGPADALVTLVVWSDFQCPFCGRLAPTLAELEKKYPHDLRVVFENNPLPMHANARPAAIAAEAAGRQGKFWQMHDKLFANQRDLTRDNFIAWAKALKLDVSKFEHDLDDPALGELIDEQQKRAARLGARGTPASFVNGRFLSGAQPLQSFVDLVETEKKAAAALVASGTPRSGVYDALMSTAKDGP